MREHPPDLAVAALVDGDAVIIGRVIPDLLHLCRRRHSVVQRHAFFQRFSFLLSERTIYMYKVLLAQLEAGVCQAVGEIAVVGQQQQPGGIVVQPAHRIKAQAAVFIREDIEDSPPAAVIAGSGQQVQGLVQHDDYFGPGMERDRFSVEGDLVRLRVDRHGIALGLPAVDGDAAHLYGADYLTPGAQAGFNQVSEQGNGFHAGYCSMYPAGADIYIRPPADRINTKQQRSPERPVRYGRFGCCAKI